MTYHASAHAVERYRERVEPCSQSEARERLLHAASIARPLSAAQTWAYLTNARRMLDRAYALYCEIESLVLLCRKDAEDAAVILTVFRREAA